VTSGSPKSRQELLEELQRLAGKLGNPPRVADMQEHGRYSHAAYYNTFDSWKDALQQAGLPSKQKKYSRQELLKELSRLAEKLGDTPRIKDIEQKTEISSFAYRNEFGSWNNALREAGFTPNVEKIGRQRLLEELRRLSKKLERTPRKLDMAKRGRYSPSAYQNEFGSWNNGLRAGGFEPNLRSEIPKPNLLAEIERLADGDVPPTSIEMGDRGKYSVSAYLRAFGSWNDALREAGYEPHVDSKVEGIDPNAYDYGDRYGSGWGSTSHQIRDEDGSCVDCGRDWSTIELLGLNFDVHHVTTCKDESPVEFRDPGPAELVPMCEECHQKWDFLGMGPDVRRRYKTTAGEEASG